MRILVTGTGGQMGRSLSELAPASGITLIGLTKDELDITEPGDVQAAVRSHAPALVVNAAGYTAVDRAEEEPDEAFAVNADGAKHLARACEAERIPLLHLSTDYVFDGTKQTPYREDDPVNPLGAYGASKAAGEAEIRGAWERHIILRSAWIFSAHGTNFVKTMLRLAGERDEISVVDDQIGCPTAARDLAAAVFRIAERLGPPSNGWGTYHFCSREAVSWCGFARAIFETACPEPDARPRVLPIATADYPTKTRRPAYSVLDCARANTAFGIERPDWRDGLHAVIETLQAKNRSPQ
jgi:dTDP-4-dehydrorhamnose reductase